MWRLLRKNDHLWLNIEQPLRPFQHLFVIALPQSILNSNILAGGDVAFIFSYPSNGVDGTLTRIRPDITLD
jgi:hypothetical protein